MSKLNCEIIYGGNFMKEYSKPVLDVEVFNTTDVVTTSQTEQMGPGVDD